MPELPEVETIVRKLRPATVGRVISNLQVYSPKSFQGDARDVLGSGVLDVGRRAKIIEIYLDRDRVLLTHLKMTGQYLFQHANQVVAGGHPTADWQQQLPGKHTRVQFDFADGAKLFFNDMRKFGWIKLVRKDELPAIYQNLGPDVIDEKLTAKYLLEQFSGRKMPIKQAIMLNEILCGVGNIYACDSLNLAKISPLRSAKSLSVQEIAQLLRAMKKIIASAIANGGTTFDGKYVDIEGKEGNNQSKVLTYGREAKSCYNCGGIIKKIKLGGRGTYYCPDCQV